MAEKKVTQEILEKVESDLNCGICLETYTNPKALPCFHVFCTKCLKSWVEKSTDKNTVYCPNCRQSVLLPKDGVDGLQSAFYIDRLFDIRDIVTKSRDTTRTQCERCTDKSIATGYCQDCHQFVCNGCKEIHKKWKKDFGSHTIVTMKDVEMQVTTIVKKKEHFCQRHPQKKIEIFCETCQELACSYCALRHHQTHQHDLVEDAFQINTDEIRKELLPVKEQHKKLKKAMKDFEKRAAEISENHAMVGDEIRKRIGHLCTLLECRKKELLDQLEQIAQQKQERLAAQKESVKALLVQVDDSISYVECSLKTNSQEEILSVKVPTLQQLRLIAADFQEDITRPKERATMQLRMTDLEMTCRELGVFVDDNELVSPDKCSVVTEEDATVFVTAEEKQSLKMDLTNEGCTISDPTIVLAELVSISDKSVTRCTITQLQDSECCIEPIPMKQGEHQLQLKIGKQHIQNSPFPVTVLPPISCPLAIIPDIEGAWGLGTTNSGYLVVSEEGANRITIFSPDGGTRVCSFGTAGTANSQFQSPRGIAIDEGDNIYVSDSQNHRIQKFQVDGGYLGGIGCKGSKKLQFNNPDGITFNKHNGNIYVCDTDNHRIQVLTKELDFVTAITSQDVGTKQLKSPEDIAFDNDGLIYIADSGNNCIQVFTANGQYSHSFGAERLKSPHGVTVDRAGKVYVVGFTNNCISIFTREGDYIQSFELTGKYPLNIIATRNKNFFVSCCGSNNILKF